MEASTQPSASSPAGASVSAASHHSRHHGKHRKGSDPFLDLADADVNLLNMSSPGNGPGNENSHSDSLLVDLVLTPLTMISFLLSLFLVDRQQRQWRKSQHSAGPESHWSRLTSWLGPEPYQDSRDATWKHSSDSASQSGDVTAFRGWYTRKKHRKVAKMEISDAFEMRRRVVFAMAAWAVLGFFALTYATRRMYGWMSRA